MMRLFLFVSALSGVGLTGCADSECSTDDDCAVDQRCIQAGGAFGGAGLCLAVDAFDPNSNFDAAQDASDAGMDAARDATDAETCTAETDPAFCARLARNCGTVTAADNCGTPRSAECGTCINTDECAADTDNCDANASCTDTIDSFTCACNQGYSGSGLTCADVDECALNTDTCSPNATCTNTEGAFSCACNQGYTGDGTTCSANPPIVAEVVTKTSSGSSIATPALAGASSDAYYVFVAMRTNSFVVNSVAGLNLSWTRLAFRCDGNNTERLEVWSAQGAATDGSITVSLSGNAYATVVSAIRVTNAAPAGATGNIIFRNSSATGDCANSVESIDYLYDYTPGTSTLVLSGVATKGRQHIPGLGFTELSDEYRSSGNGSSGLAVMSGTGVGVPLQINGAFDSTSHWASITFEVAAP